MPKSSSSVSDQLPALSRLVDRKLSAARRLDSALLARQEADSVIEISEGGVFAGLRIAALGAAAAAKRATASIALGSLFLGATLAWFSSKSYSERVVAVIGLAVFSLGAVIGREFDDVLRCRRELRRLAEQRKTQQIRVAIAREQREVAIEEATRDFLEKQKEGIREEVEAELEDERVRQRESMETRERAFQEKVSQLENHFSYLAQLGPVHDLDDDARTRLAIFTTSLHAESDERIHAKVRQLETELQNERFSDTKKSSKV